MGEGKGIPQPAAPGALRRPIPPEQAGCTVGTHSLARRAGGVALGYRTHGIAIKGKTGKRPVISVAAEFAVVMLIYLKHAWEARLAAGAVPSRALLIDAIKEGAVLRVRPKAMTVAVILAGLVPIFVGSGTGSEVMQRIAAPMIGGMITAPLLSMLIVPAAYLLLRSRGLK